jgi:AbrB family looped-hinge helix DNA binding protein
MEVVTKLADGGRVVVPSAFRRTLGLKPGDTVIMVLDDDEVRMLTPDRAIRKAQEIVRRYIPEGRSLVDELISERREEALRE